MTPGVVVCWSGYAPYIRTLRLPAEGLVLGREHANGTDDRISREHVRVQVVDGVARIQDLASRNGTFVNRYQQQTPTTSPLPAIVRAGRTVFAVVDDIEPYEDLREEGWGRALAHACTEVDAAALGEHNLTVEAGAHQAKQLARRYAERVGGSCVTYRPGLEAPSLDATLEGSRPRVVVLELHEAALSFADMPTVTTWLETDVRFVTAMWPGAAVLSMVEPRVVERLRERVIVVATPCFDELPFRLRELGQALAPNIPISPTICEGMLLLALQYDEEWLIARFSAAVAAWHAAGPPPGSHLRMQDLIHEVEPPPPSQPCIGLRQRKRRSY